MRHARINQGILPEGGTFSPHRKACLSRTPVFLRNAFACILFGIALAGCGTLPNGRGWGQDAIWPVNVKRIKESAHNAFFNPNTLIPLAGAGVFYAGDFDEKVSRWATKHHPVFGSGESAVCANRSFKNTLEIGMYATALATPSGDEPSEWIYSKSKGIGVEIAAWKAVRSATNVLKGATERTRPDGSNDTSFPSSCTSFAFSSATLSNHNLDYIDLNSNWRRGLHFGNFCLASGVAWSRVEAGAHYPSDVLAGAALGNFLSEFIYNAFLASSDDEGFGFSIVPVEDGLMAQLGFYY